MLGLNQLLTLSLRITLDEFSPITNIINNYKLNHDTSLKLEARFRMPLNLICCSLSNHEPDIRCSMEMKASPSSDQNIVMTALVRRENVEACFSLTISTSWHMKYKQLWKSEYNFKGLGFTCEIAWLKYMSCSLNCYAVFLNQFPHKWDAIFLVSWRV